MSDCLLDATDSGRDCALCAIDRALLMENAVESCITHCQRPRQNSYRRFSTKAPLALGQGVALTLAQLVCDQRGGSAARTAESAAVFIYS